MSSLVVTVVVQLALVVAVSWPTTVGAGRTLGNNNNRRRGILYSYDGRAMWVSRHLRPQQRQLSSLSSLRSSHPPPDVDVDGSNPHGTTPTGCISIETWRSMGQAFASACPAFAGDHRPGRRVEDDGGTELCRKDKVDALVGTHVNNVPYALCGAHAAAWVLATCIYGLTAAGTNESRRQYQSHLP